AHTIKTLKDDASLKSVFHGLLGEKEEENLGLSNKLKEEQANSKKLNDEKNAVEAKKNELENLLTKKDEAIKIQKNDIDAYLTTITSKDEGYRKINTEHTTTQQSLEQKTKEYSDLDGKYNKAIKDHEEKVKLQDATILNAAYDKTNLQTEAGDLRVQ